MHGSFSLSLIGRRAQLSRWKGGWRFGNMAMGAPKVHEGPGTEVSLQIFPVS